MKKTILVYVSSLALTAAAQESITVPLTLAPLSNAAVVLSASAFDAGRAQAPIVYYAAFGQEVILPAQGWLFTERQSGRSLRLGAQTAEIRFRDDAFSLVCGGQSQSLVAAGLGTESASVPPGAGTLLAFPRAYVYKGEGHLFCRSGSVRTGSVDGIALRLYDDDLDGIFARDKDGLSVGDNGGPAIFGRLAARVPGLAAAYTLQKIAEDGSSVTLARYAGPTGRLQFGAISNVECRLAFASEDGQCSFGMLAGGAPLTVPAGTYRCLYGFIYRPSARHVVGLVLPSADLPVIVGAGGDVNVTLGDLAKKDLPWGEGVVTMDFRRLLAVDLTAAEDAADAGDFAKAQQLFDAVVAKFRFERDDKPIPQGVRARFKPNPNCDASRPRLEGLENFVELENSPGGTALRTAEEKVRGLLKDGKTEEARTVLAEAQKTLAATPAIFAGSWPLMGHRTCLGILDRAAAGGPKPGVNLTLNAQKNKTVETVANVDWNDPQGQGWGHTRLYEGALVVPVAGEYEISIESVGTLNMTLDGQKFIEHPYHLPAERAAKVTLTAGAHPFRIDAQCFVYGYTHSNKPHMLRLRWTPPGQRKTIIPAWAFAIEQPGTR